MPLPEVGFLDLETVMKIFPVSKDHWREGAMEGRYPAPEKIAKKVAWRADDILELVKGRE